MKVIINSPLMGDKIIEVLNGYKDGNISYCFISKNGMRIEFEVTGMNETEAIDITKKIIRSHEFGNALYFQVITQ